jgi:hypothetical protein
VSEFTTTEMFSEKNIDESSRLNDKETSNREKVTSYLEGTYDKGSFYTKTIKKEDWNTNSH